MVSFFLGIFLGVFFGIFFGALLQASRETESTKLPEQGLEGVSIKPAV